MTRRTTIEIASAHGIFPGAALAIDDEEVVRVKAVRGTTVTVVHWRWWHTAGDRARRRLRRLRDAAAYVAVSRWCALRRHPLDDGYCRCGEREEPELEDDW